MPYVDRRPAPAPADGRLTGTAPGRLRKNPGVGKDEQWPLATEPLARYLVSDDALVSLVGWIGLMMARWEPRALARRALDAALYREDEAADSQPSFSVVEALESGTEGVREFRAIQGGWVLSEVMLTRSVDNFLTYVSELLGLVFRVRPETLRSSQQVSLEFVLSHDTQADLIDAIAERRVEHLAMQSIEALSTYFDREMGLVIFSSEADQQLLSNLVAHRNLYVHNRGLVNRRFLRLVPESGHQLGKYAELLPDDLMNGVESMRRIATGIDHAAAAKWNLDRSSERPSFLGLDEPSEGA